MCRDNSLYSTANRVTVRYDLHDEDFDDKEYYSPQWHILAGYNEQHVIAYDSVKRCNIAFKAHWGIVPQWSKTLEKAKVDSFRFVNARVETIYEKPMFKGLMAQQRCIIPSTGFFEHYESPINKLKIPFHVRKKSEDLFSIAGIYTYSNFTIEKKNPLEPDVVDRIERIRFISFTMLTTSANELMAEIHNAGENQHRMPLILSKEMEQAYMNPNLSITELQNILDYRISADELEAWPVNSIRKRNKAEDESILMEANAESVAFDFKKFNLRV